MMSNPWALLATELVGLIRDWRNPEQRRANYRLNLQKKADRKIEIAEEYIHTVSQFRYKMKVWFKILQEKHPDFISKEDEKSIRNIERYLDKYEKQFRQL